MMCMCLLVSRSARYTVRAAAMAWTRGDASALQLASRAAFGCRTRLTFSPRPARDSKVTEYEDYKFCIFVELSSLPDSVECRGVKSAGCWRRLGDNHAKPHTQHQQRRSSQQKRGAPNRPRKSASDSSFPETISTYRHRDATQCASHTTGPPL